MSVNTPCNCWGSMQRARRHIRDAHVVLGGGFGGVSTARHLERVLRRRRVEITLVSRENFFVLTPLLFAALGPAAADCPRLDRRSLLLARHHAGRPARGARARDAGAPAGGLAESLACRGLYQQQENESEGGEQAGEARTVVEGFGNHRFRGHRQQVLRRQMPAAAVATPRRPNRPRRTLPRSLPLPRWRPHSRVERCRRSCGQPRACLPCSTELRVGCRLRRRSTALWARQDPAGRFPAPSPPGRRRARCRARRPRRCQAAAIRPAVERTRRIACGERRRTAREARCSR